MEMGPVEYALIAFPGSEFSGRIGPALADLIDREVIHLIDLTFVTKQPDGTVEAIELDALPDAQLATYERLDGEVLGLLSEQDIENLAEAVEPGDSAAIIVWEDTWARPLADAVRGSGGVMMIREIVPHEIVREAVAASAATA